MKLKQIPEDFIVKETADWIVINKPIGLLVHPTSKDEKGTLIDYLVSHFPPLAKVGEDPARPGIVHRLDKEVGGLMVIAKTQSAFDDLKKQFAQHQVKKIYSAVVYGMPGKQHDDIKLAIARSTSKARMAARPKNEEGKAAWTHYQVIQKNKKTSLLQLEILSGRTHQIRAHLFAIGHPVVGDPLYRPKHFKIIEVPNIMLQSVLLDFSDPTSHKKMHFEIPLHTNFQELQKSLK